MKKIFALLMVVSVLVSCEEDVSFNTPAFQARKDNFMWRANDYSAVYNAADSTLVLNAFEGFEKVTLTAYPVIITGTGTSAFFQDTQFDLANNNDAIATYSFVNNGLTYLYSTAVKNKANGELVLRNGAIQKPGTISGTFRFDAPYIGEYPNAPERINFQEGVFYEIPISFGPEL
ncbi:DUF6252 family protein [Flavobacterium sp.]|uniref:DUF6252 family protein n=1 Tax=Flavobacterium sp. TaxID=239 RepID=UPI002635BEA9|nr:DUF6252 family protein [Flavobacterium sp.]MDD3004229.1 DUF6252 family protein [Flavobacterium sp.]